MLLSILQPMLLAAEGDQVQFTAITALIGYGPLGAFAIGVVLDKVGNHSERNRLRTEVTEKDKYIQSLHERIEGDLLPAMLGANTATVENTKALAEATALIQQIRVDRMREGKA